MCCFKAVIKCFEFQCRGLTIQVLWTGTSNAQSVRHERAFAALKCPSRGQKGSPQWQRYQIGIHEFAWQELNVTQDSDNIWHLFWKPRSDVDATVVTWGDREWGGDSSKVQQRLKKGATQVLNTSWIVLQIQRLRWPCNTMYFTMFRYIYVIV